MAEFQLTKQEIRTAQAAANSLARTYGIHPDDIAQEMMVWMFGHQPKVLEYRAGKPGLYTTLIRLGVKYCRKEWRASGGPHPDELIQQRYSRKALKGLIPQAFSSDLGQLSGTAGEYTSSSGDPALGGDLLASLVDVRSALQQLPAGQVRALLLASEYGWDNHTLGQMLAGEEGDAIGTDAARARINYYLDNMRKILNGSTWDGREVSTDEDARAFYSRQLKGLEDYAGDRDEYRDPTDGDEAMTENYYRSHGAAWDEA
jgi:DNA-directed RNA polymerase specialized sigma24 family protein